MAVSNTRKVIAAGAVGNVLEWYDFAVYGYFAAAIGRAFFPQEDKVAQVLAAFGIFAVGFLMRPVGGALIGYIGDRFGRRTALTFSVAAMAIPTFLVGVLPGYQTLGVAAPILLTLLRMIQGLSVGGEYTTSIIFMVEHARPDQRGMVGAMAGCGAVGGILAGSATGAVLAAAMPPEMLEAWGWRIPFLIGLVVGLAGFASAARHRGRGCRQEARAFAIARHAAPPRAAAAAARRTLGLQFGRLLSDLRLHRELAAACRRRGAGAGARDQYRQHGRPGAADRGDGLALRPDRPAAGHAGRHGLCLRLGRGRCSGCCTAPTRRSKCWASWASCCAVGTFIGCQPALMVEAVPGQVRCTAIALGFNVTAGLAGGLSPLVATWLVHRTDNNYSPAFMIMAAAAISFIAILNFKETFRTPLGKA